MKRVMWTIARADCPRLEGAWRTKGWLVGELVMFGDEETARKAFKLLLASNVQDEYTVISVEVCDKETDAEKVIDSGPEC